MGGASAAVSPQAPEVQGRPSLRREWQMTRSEMCTLRRTFRAPWHRKSHRARCGCAGFGGWARGQVPGVTWKLPAFKNTECFSYVRGDVSPGGEMHTCTRTLTPAQTQPHTPATPLPSRMFSCSRAPQCPSTEGSVLKCGGLCFLTCGTAGASCNPGDLRRGRARAAGCSVSKRASLPPLDWALRGSWDGQLGGMRTSPSPGVLPRPRGWNAFLRGPSSWSFIGQTRIVQTLVHRIPLTLPGSLPTPLPGRSPKT